MKIKMMPNVSSFTDESGIRRVVEAYYKYLPQFGVSLVEDDYNLLATHAGMYSSECDVAHLHGLYFTGDYEAKDWERQVNIDVVNSIRHSYAATVPSQWVAEVLYDMRIRPYIVPHGIEWEEWQEDAEPGDYVLWNKNRTTDVCGAEPLGMLASSAPNTTFVSTFSPKIAPDNIIVINKQPHDKMKKIVQSCSVYLSTTKETFGIGVLEAMAAGKPILGYREGGIVDLVQHGVNGYLAVPGSIDDLADGLAYCQQHAHILGHNSREMVKQYSWQNAILRLIPSYENALLLKSQPALVTVIIPCYNKEDTLARSVESALAQEKYLYEVIIIDDGSTDGSREIGEKLAEHEKVTYHHQQNSGVAVARNMGVSMARTKYVVCLDADDWIDPRFLSATVPVLEEDRSLGIAYTKLTFHKPDGETGVSPWPDEFNYDQQLRRRNQIPTCCLFRRDMWESLGGYKSRYCPTGAGSEDAEFWLRAGAYGYGAKLASDAALFHYSFLSGHTAQEGYSEVDWMGWHPWTKDNIHPPISIATPEHISHPVYQKDKPVVSFVIPVGPGHEHLLIDALDSIEAQTFRNTETIVVNDTGSPLNIMTAYPHVKLIQTGSEHGAGAARNLGASIARSPFLVFLDADDYLLPDFTRTVIDAYTHHEAIIYTDYYGHAHVTDESKLAPDLRDGIVERNGDQIIAWHASAEYDCERTRQPFREPIYVWCITTCLIPREWHNAVGGFDETMPTWEDIDYFYRLSHAGYCFKRVTEALVMYRLSTGTRRNEGLKLYKKMIQYMTEKYRKETPMGCSGCGKSRPTVSYAVSEKRVVPTGDTVRIPRVHEGLIEISNTDLVEARYLSPRSADHRVIGPITRLDYGYHAKDDVFSIHRDDLSSGLFMEVSPRIIKSIIDEKPVTPEPPVVIKEQPAPPKVLEPILAEQEPVEPEKPVEPKKPTKPKPRRRRKLEIDPVTGKKVAKDE